MSGPAPQLLPRSWQSVETLEYARLDERSSVVQVLAALDPTVAPTVKAQLLVTVELGAATPLNMRIPLTLGALATGPIAAHPPLQAGRLRTSHPGFAYAIEESESGLVRRVSFDVPLEIV